MRYRPFVVMVRVIAKLFAIALLRGARWYRTIRFRSLSLLLKASLLNKLSLARAQATTLQRAGSQIARLKVITFAQRNDRIVSGQQGRFTESGRSSS